MYGIARSIAQCIVATFFGEVRAVGLERIPVEGPVIFVGNHNNQFVDASIIMSCVPRPLRFLIATVSLKIRVVGRLAKFAGAIGVSRPQDMKFVGMGKIISVTPKDDDPKHCWVIGNSITRFRIDCKKHDKIQVNGQTLVVEAVDDDHHMLVSKQRPAAAVPESPTATPTTATPPNSPFESQVSKRSPEVLSASISQQEHADTAWSFTVFPKVDQGDVYESVSRALYEGSSICIFPEGGSHDRPELLPLKPGVAVMALNSAVVGVEDLLIVPVGIHYFDRHKFGSKAVVEIGQPIPIRDELIQMYTEQPGCKKEAVQRLLTEVKEGMENCLIYADSYEKLKVIELCASLYPPDRMIISMEKAHRLQALFTQIVNRAEEESRELEEHVLGYGRLLEANGLQDTDVLSMQLNAEHAAAKLLGKIIPTMLLSLIVVPAIMCIFPIKYVFRRMTEKHRSQALAKSNVKLTAADVIASYKIVWWMCFMPFVFMCTGLVTSYWIKRYYKLSFVGWVFTFAATLIIQPIATYWGLLLQNTMFAYLKQMRCYYRVLISELDVWRGGEREVIVDRIDLQLKVRQYVKALLLNKSNDKRLQEILSDLEKLIPVVVIDHDTRRLQRHKDKLLPVVYRSAVMSREEIL